MSNQLVESICKLIEAGGISAVWVVVVWQGIKLLINAVWICFLLVFIARGYKLLRLLIDRYWNHEDEHH